MASGSAATRSSITVAGASISTRSIACGRTDTRAVLAVAPNNPTGSCLSDADAAGLVARCATRDAALILDEVFIDYPLRDAIPEAAPLAVPGCLLFRLGGLSKSAGLPQLKLGWMTVEGPAATRGRSARSSGAHL